MEFRFETKPTFEDYKALAYAMGKTINRKTRTTVRTVLLICGIFILLSGLFMLFVGIIARGVVTPLFTGSVALAVGVLYIVYYCSYDHLVAKRNQKAQKGSRVLDQTVTLTEEACLAESDGASSRYTYPAFIGLLYYQERYFLVLDKSHALVLPLANLTEGDPAQLGPFLEQELGRPVKEVK